MIKKIAWEAFKNTGNINTYLELKQIEDIEDKIEKQQFNFEDTNNEQMNINLENIDTKNTINKEI